MAYANRMDVNVEVHAEDSSSSMSSGSYGTSASDSDDLSLDDTLVNYANAHKKGDNLPDDDETIGYDGTQTGIAGMLSAPPLGPDVFKDLSFTNPGLHSTPMHHNPRGHTTRPRGKSDKRKKKRNSQQEELNCLFCQTDVAPEDDVQCKMCEHLICKNCSGLKPDIIEMVNTGALEEFMYFCRLCKGSFPSWKQIGQKLENLEKNNEAGFKVVDRKLNQLQIQIKQEVNKAVDDKLHSVHLKVEKLEKKVDEKVGSVGSHDSISKEIKKQLDAYDKKRRDDERRRTNVIGYKIPEPATPIPERRQQEDRNFVQSVLAEAGDDITNFNIKTTKRLGDLKPDDEQHVRPMLIGFENGQEAEKFRNVMRDLHKKDTSSTKKQGISFTKDRSKEDRIAYAKRKAERDQQARRRIESGINEEKIEEQQRFRDGPRPGAPNK